MRVLRFILGLIFLALIPGYTIRFLHLFKYFNFENIFFKAFLFGAVVFLILWILIIHRAKFFLTFEHEMTHLLMGLLFFKNPAAFWATDTEGGFVQLYGHNFIIGLAPYFLPTISFILMPVIFLIRAKFLPHYFFILGFFTAYHILSTIKEFGYWQPDIQQAGKIFSTIFLILMNIVCYGIILAFVFNGFDGSWHFLKNGFLNSIAFLKRL